MRRGNGFGSVFKLSGKRRKPWAVRVTIGWTNEGKQIYKYIGYYMNKTEAKRALDSYNTNPHDQLEEKATLREVYERWEKQSELNSLKNYKSAFNKCSMLHNRNFADITIPELKDQLQNYSPTTKRFYKLLMNNLYKFGIEHQIVHTNLSEFITVKTVEPKEKNIFTSDEIQKLWDNLDNHRDADIVLILLYTGMRISELLEMKCESVHIDERYMVGGVKTAAGKNRIIPIHWKIKPLIEKRLAEGRTYLISSVKGNRTYYPDFVKTGGAWQQTTTQIGVSHTPHETRHTFITRMDQLGVNRVALKRIVGHTTKTDITDHYTHKTVTELLEAIDRLEY